MKSVIDKGLALGVLEKKKGDYVVSDAASRDQINAYVQFLLEEMTILEMGYASLQDEICWLREQKENLEGQVLDAPDFV